jgi:hypothetical protein
MELNHGSLAATTSSLGTFAAELTIAAYPIALRHGIHGSWFQLEVDLWTALVRVFEQWQHDTERQGQLGRFETWRENLLAELTDAAYRTTLSYKVQGSFLDLELSLFGAFRSVIEEICLAHGDNRLVGKPRLSVTESAQVFRGTTFQND